jgi:hypothetical protein
MTTFLFYLEGDLCLGDYYSSSSLRDDYSDSDELSNLC